MQIRSGQTNNASGFGPTSADLVRVATPIFSGKGRNVFTLFRPHYANFGPYTVYF